ncbi:flagellar protein FliS [Microcella daejeonensis]|uniref:Flagellar protein FliS n=1 Tax=Microcella daejeonensis TaxID=2994971 RepID=A0A9E8S8X5_9MICO|nr:flagellar export chaperone FliS [Microcella daejeonensis]WAB81743.1 flagellar protein FliS [Microcella daejeonensis]
MAQLAALLAADDAEAVVTAAERMLAQYRRDAVLSASPARLLVMLMDRLALDLDRAAEAQDAQDREAERRSLGNAQAIVAELMGSLDVDAWEGGPQLLALYGHLTTQLLRAGIDHDPTITRACARVVAPLREAWRDAAESLAAEPAVAVPLDGIRGVG